MNAIINVQSGLVKPYVAKRGRPRIKTIVERNLINEAEINVKKEYKVKVAKIINIVLEKVKEELMAELFNEEN